jgi:hypothetical protein
VARETEEWTLKICGAGPLRDQLVALIADSDAADRVERAVDEFIANSGARLRLVPVDTARIATK